MWAARTDTARSAALVVLYDGGAEDVTIIVTDWEQLEVLGESSVWC